MNTLLILETASSKPFILLKTPEITEFIPLLDGSELSKNIHKNISNLLSKSSLTLQDINTVALGIGPGSYTGLRVGAAIAKTLSFSLKIPICTFYSLEAFIPENTVNFWIISSARSRGLYALRGNNNILSKPQVIDHKMFLELRQENAPFFSLDQKLLEQYPEQIKQTSLNLNDLLLCLEKKVNKGMHKQIELSYP